MIPLADHTAPPMPADEYVRRWLGRLRALTARRRAKPFIADDKLKRASLDRLDELVALPACGPALDELDRAVREWLAEVPRAADIKVVVVPPCDESAIIQGWASRAGHPILPAPPRDTLIELPSRPLPDLTGDGLLVVPRLEDWFLRHRNGLRTIRALLAALDTSGRPVLIGCNSWAWAFLAKAVAADQLLPDPVTFAAFDEMRLHGWFSGLAAAPVRFRHAQTGADVLELGEGGTPKDDFLRRLAGRSLGIPWVAWHMWRRSLRSDDEGAGEQILWVAALEELVLPGAHGQSALLVLQALLIHGALTAEQLRLVLPIVGESNIVPVLVRAGFLDREGDLFSCRPAAYPTIRAGLETAGLPLDRV